MQPQTSIPYTVHELKQMLGYADNQPDLDTSVLWMSDFYQHFATESCFTFYTLTDYTRQKYLFVSPMAEMLTGYTRQMIAKGGLQFMLSLVHPSEMASLRLIHQQIITFFQALPLCKKQNYSYAYNVSIRKADDTYMHLLCQLSCEQLTNDGRLFVGKEMFTNITFYNQANCMQLIICDHTKTSDNQNLVYCFNPGTGQSKLSAREKEVSDLVNLGHSSKKIGEMLNLSKHTIDTYRRKIKRKG